MKFKYGIIKCQKVITEHTNILLLETHSTKQLLMYDKTCIVSCMYTTKG